MKKIVCLALILSIISLIITLIFAFNLYKENKKLKEDVLSHEALVNDLARIAYKLLVGNLKINSESNMEILQNNNDFKLQITDLLMRYEPAPDLKRRLIEIVQLLNMNHIKLDRIECLRSFGSSSKRTIARCHTLGKLMQKAMQTKSFYAIEFLERFDKMNKIEQDKVIIHELMHVPKTFGGGFRQHDFVCEKNINILHEKFANLKKERFSENVYLPIASPLTRQLKF